MCSVYFLICEVLVSFQVMMSLDLIYYLNFASKYWKKNAFWFCGKGFIWLQKYSTYFITHRICCMKCLCSRCFLHFWLREQEIHKLYNAIYSVSHFWRHIIVFFSFLKPVLKSKGHNFLCFKKRFKR